MVLSLVSRWSLPDLTLCQGVDRWGAAGMAPVLTLASLSACLGTQS